MEISDQAEKVQDNWTACAFLLFSGFSRAITTLMEFLVLLLPLHLLRFYVSFRANFDDQYWYCAVLDDIRNSPENHARFEVLLNLALAKK